MTEENSWKCEKCGYTFKAKTPPDKCTACGESCSFLNVTCYTPDCKEGGCDFDPRLG